MTTQGNTFRLLAGATLVLALAACGSDSRNTGTVNGEPVAVAAVPTAAINAGPTASLTGPALCNVNVSRIDYDTVGGKGENTNATAAVMVPSGSNAACSGARPIVLYAHGTSTDKNKDMANVSGDSEAGLIMSVYAAQGFIVVAPNYAGYGASRLSYHPYLNAEQQSRDMTDALRAAKSVLGKLNATASSKLFIAGYSQGGHVAMATVKAIQTNLSSEFTVTASVPMSGPYALTKLATTALNNPALQTVGSAIFAPMLIDSYQNSYGNIYTSPSEIYNAPYSTTVIGLLPSTNPNALAALPAGADQTYRTLYDQGNGQPFLITTAYQNAAKNTNSTFLQAFARNDLTTGWKPGSPMALCYGALDMTVPGFNSVDAQTAFALPSLVQRWDLEDLATLPAGAGPLKAGFDAQKTQGIAAAGGGALGTQIYIASSYHGGLVPPFCNQLAALMFKAL